MKYYGRAESVAQKIIETFKNGNIPKALAPVFICRKDNVPCRSWSWGNQLLCAINGTNDARGFKQWGAVDRSVKKGSKAFDIFVPLIRRKKIVDENTGSEKEVPKIYGFKTAPVFPIELTDGNPLPEADPEVRRWIDNLPLLEVAKSWGLQVDACNGRENGSLGKYCHGKEIVLAVTNLSTWAHELMHAADDRLGNLKERGQHWRSETVAELGGAILLESLGLEQDSDRGGCWQYLKSYADAAEIQPMQACMDVLSRTCEAVNLLLAEAEKFEANFPMSKQSGPV
jgi:hypothetical protein